MICEVLRPIDALGQKLMPGTIVNVDTWRSRNVQALIANNRLRELVPAAPAEPLPEGLEWQLVPTGTTKSGKAGKEK